MNKLISLLLLFLLFLFACSTTIEIESKNYCAQFKNPDFRVLCKRWQDRCIQETDLKYNKKCYAKMEEFFKYVRENE